MLCVRGSPKQCSAGISIEASGSVPDSYMQSFLILAFARSSIL